MKKVYLIVALSLLTFSSLTSNAQIDFGLKGGLNFNSSTIEKVSSVVTSGVENASIDDVENKSGFHVGIWARFKIPVIGLYVRPELIYPQLKNNFKYKNDITTVVPPSSAFNFQKIDIPVLIGKKFFGVGNVFIGPSFQYILSSDFGLENIKNIESEGFSAGLQFGGGVELGKFGVDVRWERSFSDFETSFIDVDETIRFDTRVNQIILGISYRF